MFLLTLPPLAPQETEQLGAPVPCPGCACSGAWTPLPTSCVSRGGGPEQEAPFRFRCQRRGRKSGKWRAGLGTCCCSLARKPREEFQKIAASS